MRHTHGGDVASESGECIKEGGGGRGCALGFGGACHGEIRR